LHPLIRKKIEAEATRVFWCRRVPPCCASMTCWKAFWGSRRKGKSFLVPGAAFGGGARDW